MSSESPAGLACRWVWWAGLSKLSRDQKPNNYSLVIEKINGNVWSPLYNNEASSLVFYLNIVSIWARAARRITPVQIGSPKFPSSTPQNFGSV